MRLTCNPYVHMFTRDPQRYPFHTESGEEAHQERPLTSFRALALASRSCCAPWDWHAQGRGFGCIASSGPKCGLEHSRTGYRVQGQMLPGTREIEKQGARRKKTRRMRMRVGAGQGRVDVQPALRARGSAAARRYRRIRERRPAAGN